MRVLTRDGRLFQGTPKQIVEAMRGLDMGAWPTLRGYMSEAARRARALGGADVPDPEGPDDASAAAAFVESLLAAGMLVRAGAVGKDGPAGEDDGGA